MHLEHPDHQVFFDRLLARLRLGRFAAGPAWSTQPAVAPGALGRRRVEHPAGAYAAAQRVVDRMPSKPTIVHRAGPPAYLPGPDLIWLPDKDHFAELALYFATLFRLLVVATAREGRLGRDGRSREREGLVGGLGAVFLCGQVRLLSQTLEHEAGSIDVRLRALGRGRAPLFEAAEPAERAVDWILGHGEGAKRTA
jgi:antirestriction protein ArdC